MTSSEGTSREIRKFTNFARAGLVVFVKTVFVDPQGFDLRFERRRRKSQSGRCPGRSGNPSSRFSENGFYRLFFLSGGHFEKWPQGLSRRIRLVGSREPAFIDHELFRFTENGRALDYILQLSDISGPGV